MAIRDTDIWAVTLAQLSFHHVVMNVVDAWLLAPTYCKGMSMPHIVTVEYGSSLAVAGCATVMLLCGVPLLCWYVFGVPLLCW